MGEHRKLVAIMFTDIVGYTSLMADNERNALEILHKNRDTVKHFVAKHNGEFLKEMGDGSLSSFDSVVDSVNCALEIQNSLVNEKDYKLRIGVHMSDVVVEASGDVFGDGVNVASRIESLAEPGGIYVSGQVYSNIRNKSYIHAKYIGEKKLKNVDEVIELYELDVVHLRKANGRRVKIFSIQHRKWNKRFKFFLLLFLVLIASYKIKTQFFEDSRELHSIAVLPFVDMSASADHGYICDGIVEEILHALANVNELRVIARTTSFTYRGEEKDIKKIGRELNVDTILEGSIRIAGDKIRVTTQLNKVSDQSHLFSTVHEYDYDLEGLFSMQDTISHAVVMALKGKVLQKDKDAIMKRPTDNLEAYELYMKARDRWYTREGKGYREAIELYSKAVDIDPKFTQAHVGIANAYNLMGFHSIIPPATAYRNAEEALKKALKIDDTDSDAHASMGWINLYYKWDMVTANRNFKKAIDLNPSNALAHMWHRDYLLVMGRWEEAIAEMHEGMKLDPLSGNMIFFPIVTYGLAGKYKDAENEFNKAIAQYPESPLPHLYIAKVYSMNKQYDKARNALMTARKISKNPNAYEKIFGYHYAFSGNNVQAEKYIQKLIEEYQNNNGMAYSIALMYCGMGRIDDSFEWLYKAYDFHSSELVYVKSFPEWEGIRKDPRYNDLLNKMGLSRD